MRSPPPGPATTNPQAPDASPVMTTAYVVCREGLGRLGVDVLPHIVRQIDGFLDSFSGPDAMMIACQRGASEHLLTLLASRDPASYWKDAAKLAMEFGHVHVLQWLSENHPDRCEWSTYLMDMAARFGRFAIVRWLHDNRSEGCTTLAMDWALYCSDMEMVQWLHANRTEGCSTQVMTYAAFHGQLPALQWLVANQIEGRPGEALAEAASNGHLKVVKWLCNQCDDADLHLALGEALLKAAANGRLKMVKWLCSQRDDTGRHLASGEALGAAAANGYLEIVQFLYDQCDGADRHIAWRNATRNGNALDKAKSFLSKYSTVAVGDSKAATSSRRVELSLDDDDFSMDSSDDDDGDRTTKSKTAVGGAAHSVSTVRKKDDSPLQSPPRLSTSAPPSESHRNVVDSLHSDKEDDRGDEGDALPLDASRNATISPLSTVVATRQEERSSDGSLAGSSIESFHNDSDEEAPEPPPSSVTALTRPAYLDRQEASDDEYLDSFQEESVVSQRDVSPRQTVDVPSRQVLASNRPRDSESGVYDEENFEDEEESTTTAAAEVDPNAVLSPLTAKTEAVFDYSMDFSEDEVEEQTPHRAEFEFKHDDAVQPVAATEALDSKSLSASGASADDDANVERSAFLESDDSEEDNHRQNGMGGTDPAVSASDEADRPPDSTPSDLGDPSQAVSEAREIQNGLTPRKSAVFLEEAVSLGSDRAVDNAHSAATTTTAARTAPLEARAVVEARTAPERPRVTIIRPCAPEPDGRVEMKDASTQFTGNHAAIQTDLVPDGMHNLSLPPPAPPSQPVGSHRGAEASTRDSQPYHRPINQPPPPPVTSSVFGSSSYNMEALKLPMATSTSIYKQQLLALQDQILQKKRETERLVHDRMAFQYSSLRGTERFLAARRPQKLELWEALMRVDPTLDERRAREVARLAQITTS
ncbi:hypothetical protein BBJ28_00009551 [Nothophytophthora sp. Chile5]|nr:hypothetical protein BBJ28_00009551 [Nothophytophthora sp. Chile5]